MKHLYVMLFSYEFVLAPHTNVVIPEYPVSLPRVGGWVQKKQPLILFFPQQPPPFLGPSSWPFKPLFFENKYIKRYVCFPQSFVEVFVSISRTRADCPEGTSCHPRPSKASSGWFSLVPPKNLGVPRLPSSIFWVYEAWHTLPPGFIGCDWKSAPQGL